MPYVLITLKHWSYREIRVMTWMDEQIGQLEMSELICLTLERSPTKTLPEQNQFNCSCSFRISSMVLSFYSFKFLCICQVSASKKLWYIKILSNKTAFLEFYDLSNDYLPPCKAFLISLISDTERLWMWKSSATAWAAITINISKDNAKRFLHHT